MPAGQLVRAFWFNVGLPHLSESHCPQEPLDKVGGETRSRGGVPGWQREQKSPPYQTILHSEVEMLSGHLFELRQELVVFRVLWLLISDDFDSLQMRSVEKGVGNG